MTPTTDSATTRPDVDPAKLDAFMGKVLTDMGGALDAALILIGDKLGLFRALAEAPMSSADLAARTTTSERYVREWLCAMAAGGYCQYDAAAQRFSLSPEQVFALAMEGSPAFVPGAFQLITALVKDEEKVTEVFRSGKGLGWHEHHHDLFHGTERFFRPGYTANLVSSWIPALAGVETRLRAGARVADVGCGHGASTILMAQAFPESRFFGFDYHEASIRWAKKAAESAGVGQRVTFAVARANEYPGRDYDLVTLFDCLHDMGDPVSAARHVKETLRPDGTWMLVEPFAGDRVEDNLNPVGRVFYAASTLVCTPASLAQEVGLALGAQAGEARLREITGQAGFSRFRRATQTPFNLVLEIRP